MKKSITISIFVLLVITTIFFFNNIDNSIVKNPPKYVLLNSDFQKIKSTISFFGNDKSFLNKNTYSISGLENLSYHNEKIGSLSSYQSKLIEIDLKKNFESTNKTSRLPYPLFHWSDSENSISIYNYDEKQDMNFFTYDFSHHNAKNKPSILRRMGIPFASSVINNKLLTYTRDMNRPTDKQFSFSIIPIDSKKKIMSIPINKPLATRIEPSYHQGNYYIMTEDFKTKQNTLIKIDDNSYKISFNKLSANDCDAFDVNEKGISSLHFSIDSIKFNQFNLKGNLIKEKEFNGINLIKSKFINNQPYMIYQKKDKTFLGKISKGWKLITIMKVHKDTKDFLVL